MAFIQYGQESASGRTLPVSSGSVNKHGPGVAYPMSDGARREAIELMQQEIAFIEQTLGKVTVEGVTLDEMPISLNPYYTSEQILYMKDRLAKLKSKLGEATLVAELFDNKKKHN